MFKKIFIVCLLALTACQKSKDGDQPAVSPQIEAAQKLFQNKAQKVNNPEALLGLWESKANTDADSALYTRAFFENNKVTIAATCEFYKNSVLTDKLFASVESEASFDKETLTVKSSAEYIAQNDKNACKVFIRAGTLKYTIDPETKKLCVGEVEACVLFDKIAD